MTDTNGPAFRAFAPAKINLTLDVLGKRTDGYHELFSLVAFARDVGDEVSLDTSRPVAVTADGPFSKEIQGQNLLATALSKLAAAAPDLKLGAVHLTKNLPVAAGIGGGSADAAALLRAVRAANPGHAASLDWLRIASELGADVPVCLSSHAAYMRGVGETVTPLPSPLPEVYVLIVYPGFPGLPNKTGQVFKKLAAPPLDAAPPLPEQPQFTTASALMDYLGTHGNTLEKPATQLMPAIAGIKARMQPLPGARLVRLSGAGPACIALFASEVEASTAQMMVKREGRWWAMVSALQ